MKILPKHDSLRSLVYWFLGIGFFLILFLPYAVGFSFKAHILFLILAILLIFTPWANRRIPIDETNPTQKRLPFAKSLGLTWLLTISLILAFYSISHLAGHTLPIGTKPLPLFEFTLPILWRDWGIFPWGIYALMAVSLSYIGYIRKQPGNMSTLVRPIVKNSIGDTISLTADVVTKLGISLSLGCTLGLIAMECVGLIHQSLAFPMAYGPRIDVFLLILLVLQGSKGDFLEKRLGWLIKRRVPVLIIVSGFLLLLIFGILISGMLLAWSAPIFTPGLSRLLSFSPEDWPIIWILFSAIWWLGWAPVVAATFAYLWRGYTIRTLMVSTLLLPITAGVFIYLYPHWRLNENFNNSLWNILPALLSAAIMMGLFLRINTIAYVWKGMLPTERQYRQNPKTFLIRLSQAILLMMGLYWGGGIYIPGWLYFPIMFPVGLFAFTAGIAVLWVLWERRLS